MSEARLHIIQNDPEVPPGIIVNYISIPYVVVHPYRGDDLPEIRQISALIVMGGAMGANDDGRYPFLTDLKKLICETVSARIPYLGVCLGGQLLASALRSKVVSHRWEELGTFAVKLTEDGRKDPLFRDFSEEFTTFQWHHDSFDIPTGGVLLASSDACPHQAFRIGCSAWGVQFHPEVNEQIIRKWCAWDSETLKKTEEMLTSFEAEIVNYRRTARQIINNFLSAAKLNPVKDQI
jgi:GMP synthase-like glutamine amidotransferase